MKGKLLGNSTTAYIFESVLFHWGINKLYGTDPRTMKARIFDPGKFFTGLYNICMARNQPLI